MHEHVSIDEAMIMFKGRLGFKTSLPSGGSRCLFCLMPPMGMYLGSRYILEQERIREEERVTYYGPAVEAKSKTATINRIVCTAWFCSLVIIV